MSCVKKIRTTYLSAYLQALPGSYGFESHRWHEKFGPQPYDSCHPWQSGFSELNEIRELNPLLVMSLWDYTIKPSFTFTFTYQAEEMIHHQGSRDPSSLRAWTNTRLTSRTGKDDLSSGLKQGKGLMDQTNGDEEENLTSRVSFTQSSPRTASLLHAGMPICQPKLAKVGSF
ncbi:unnamed protein product, partial [Nesidiocoris tenuis]